MIYCFRVIKVDMETKTDGWQYIQGTKASHWIDLYDIEYGTPWTKASVKWDGCVHFSTVANTPYVIGKPADETQCENYIHICNIDRFIKQLERLRDAAKSHFGDDWPL